MNPRLRAQPVFVGYLAAHPSQQRTECIQIMHFAEQILHALQVRFPLRIAAWEEIFGRITKPLEGDPRAMPGDGATRMPRTLILGPSFLPALQRQMLGYQAILRDALRAGG